MKATGPIGAQSNGSFSDLTFSKSDMIMSSHGRESIAFFALLDLITERIALDLARIYGYRLSNLSTPGIRI